ncbi:MAG: ATP-grasp domain-containing protein [bacterium]|nr:ATP-grasp domain-containing protein [bacterium]
MKTVMIIGAGIMQVAAIKKARSMGLRVLATDINPAAPGFKFATYKELVSTKDIPGSINAAKRYKIDGVLTIGTDRSRTVSAIAKKLGLPGISEEVALLATNKAKMRRRFKERGVPSPDFREVKKIEDAIQAGEELGYPLVVKPVDNMGARGVKGVKDKYQLSEAFYKALEWSDIKSVIIEQWMEGPELSIDTIVYNGEIHLLTIADRIIEFEPYFVETGHTIPSSLHSSQLDNAFEVMKTGIQALGIDWGAAKCDMKVTKNGAMIGELAARLSGGFHCQATAPLATGMDCIKAVIDLSLGNPLDIRDITPRFNHAACERALIPKPGRVIKITGVDKARNLQGVKDVIINVKIGDVVTEQVDNMRKAGHIIAYGETRSDAIRRCEKARDMIKIITKGR